MRVKNSYRKEIHATMKIILLFLFAALLTTRTETISFEEIDNVLERELLEILNEDQKIYGVNKSCDENKDAQCKQDVGAKNNTPCDESNKDAPCRKEVAVTNNTPCDESNKDAPCRKDTQMNTSAWCLTEFSMYLNKKLIYSKCLKPHKD